MPHPARATVTPRRSAQPPRRPRRLLLGALTVLALTAAGLALPTTATPAYAAGATTAIENYDSAGHPATKFDTDGNALDAHEPYIAQFGGTYYLYGTSMGCGSLSSIPTQTPFCGDKVYTSPDLTHWTDSGAVSLAGRGRFLFDPTTSEWQNRCSVNSSTTSPQSSCFRPKVIYNAGTGKYVLWVNYGVAVNNGVDTAASQASTGKYFVLESNSPTGPFVPPGGASTAHQATLAHSWDNDETLFVDTDGSAYVTYMWQQTHSLYVEKLDAAYENGTGQVRDVGTTTLNQNHNIGSGNTNESEAPAMFRRGSTYYLTYSSPPYPFGSVDTEYKTASSPLGVWSAPQPLSSGNTGDPHFCGGQASSVLQVATTSGDAYLFQLDLWDKVGSSPATSNDYFAPLSFNSDGSIAQLNCGNYPTVNLNLTVGSPGIQNTPAGSDQNNGTSTFYNWCDIYSGRIRAQTFTPSAAAAGNGVEVSVNIHQQSVPNNPVVLDLRTVDVGTGRPTGTTLASASYTPSQVSWSPRQLTVSWNGPIVAGNRYAVVVHSSATSGCYGWQRHDGARYTAGGEYFSSDNGSSWTSPEPFDMKFATRTLNSTNPSAPTGSAAWAFDEGSGTTAADSSGGGNTAMLQGAASWTSSTDARNGASALHLDGTTGYARATGPVIDTSQSFTVSAWAKLSKVDNGAYVVASVDGAVHSGFYLEYCGFCGNGGFDLTMVNSDSVGASAVRATSTQAVAAGTWYHLVGVYDASAAQIRLYVDNQPAVSSAFGSGWRATGDTVVGRGKYNGSASNFWPGTLDDVRLNAGVLAP